MGNTASLIACIDSEIGIDDNKIHDLGAVRSDGSTFHSASVGDLARFIAGCDYVCGHNIIHHDLPHINTALGKTISIPAIDTLYLSPLFFPKQPYHALVKDDKLQVEELNNPVNDSKKAQKLFYDEVNAYQALPVQLKQIFGQLLSPMAEFKAFFDYVGYRTRILQASAPALIRTQFKGRLCTNADLNALTKRYPVELAYALALIWANDSDSITPPWLLNAYPQIQYVLKVLRHVPCKARCEYCRGYLDIHRALKRYFGFDEFRLYGGDPLQERAVQAAVDGESLLAVFPTGGGKSLAFQLPALMEAEAVKGLTVVISPLQSLMKDQVDNLIARGVTCAVTINGSLDPVERAHALEQISNGSAHLLYISPEQLRSRTIERLLISRHVVRFVIDEAHCFSAWGQDFRVDYLYIGDFIRMLQEKRLTKEPIPVSCFTATAKQKVISDIRDYFNRTLGLELRVFATSATRENLHYVVLHCETDEEKYVALRNLMTQDDRPTIVYVSRTRRAQDLADRLSRDGIPSKPYHGKMDPTEKVANQEAFIRNEIQAIVATSAFGMGVDKKDVRLVVHYEISSSLEDYVQEAGRAGRDPVLSADCYVLYNDGDLDKHFLLLNQTKLSMSEIQQVWRAVKTMTKTRPSINCSALEIARQAGWVDSGADVETKVRTAVQALENAGYVRRGQNVPHVYATGINAKSVMEATAEIERSSLFDEREKMNARRIISSLIGQSYRAAAGNDEAESRIDYLADMLGLTKGVVIRSVNLMRQAGILDDSQDMTAYIQANETVNKSLRTLERFVRLERFLFERFEQEGCTINLKELNGEAQASGIRKASVRDMRTLLYYLSVKGYIQKEEVVHADSVRVFPTDDLEKLRTKLDRRVDICQFALKELATLANDIVPDEKGQKLVRFSLVGLFKQYQAVPRLQVFEEDLVLKDVSDALLYLSKIGAIQIEGGFLVLYNGLQIQRLELDNRIQYKVSDYRFLDEYYKQKIQMIHIVGEYANLMVSDYEAALAYVSDYFQMDYKSFVATYFKGERAAEINRNITPSKYRLLFDELSEVQQEIINNKDSRYIVVSAGPGSGKTRVLVHKLASLLLLEDVKHDQLLMLTFSRAAATEFKLRLINLIGNAANFVDIKTFHSYCFDLLGKIGNLEESENVVADAAALIASGEVEPGKITKSVLVIDEAQDMSDSDFSLIEALMAANDGMRVIAVGDDDQNIYSFRGSDSKHLRKLIEVYGAKTYEMPDNYRSSTSIVGFANAFVARIHNRMKQTDCRAVRDDEGTVIITRHTARSFEEALVNDVIRTHRDERACVLTQTNEEALLVLSMLQERGLSACLIQSLGRQFRLSNLVEIRYFLSVIGQDDVSAIVPEAAWNEAKERLRKRYAKSANLGICLRLIGVFEDAYPQKYRSDLDEFINESQLEDFLDNGRAKLYVSTIHKAKGREFDTVYMLLQRRYPQTDERLRALYVGMTRAKNALYIHCNREVLGHTTAGGVRFLTDTVTYGVASEMLVQLTHRDVFLGYFNSDGRQRVIERLYSGMRLGIEDNELFVRSRDGRSVHVARFSKAFAERLAKWAAAGYWPTEIVIRHILWWKGEEDERETLIVLPTIKLRRA